MKESKEYILGKVKDSLSNMEKISKKIEESRKRSEDRLKELNDLINSL